MRAKVQATAKNNWKYDRSREMRKAPTPGERLLWSRLQRRQLDVKIRRQAVLFGYIADFYCASAKLVIEVDGNQHLQQVQYQYDRERDTHLAARGLRTLRFAHADVMDRTYDVVEAIRHEIESSLQTKGLPGGRVRLESAAPPAPAEGGGGTS